MPFEGFVHPALAFGAALAAVPLIIHLLNRQRHKPLEWAAMTFVLAAYRRTRRRAQLENLLLLLLRMLAVILLAFAVSRPFTGSESPLAALTESRRDVVLVLDGSASTGYRDGPSSVFERELERARELLSDLDGARGDRARLILADTRPRLLAARSPEDALAALTTLSVPTDDSLELTAALAEVLRLATDESAGTGASELEVRILTDLQRRSFATGAADDPDGAEAGARPPLLATLDRLEELGVEVRVEDLGAAALVPPNLTIEEVRPLARAPGAGVPVDVAVTVANRGAAGRSDVRVTLASGGQRLPARSLDVPGRGRATAIFPVVFPRAGEHTLEASLEGDQLEVDDHRATVVRVPPPVRVLLVNGSPRPAIVDDEVGFLRAILESPDDGRIGAGDAPFLPRVATERALLAGEVDPTEFDVVLLANVFALQDGVVRTLERHVAAGASLVIALGDEVDLPRFERTLGPSDGSGLSPAALHTKVEVPSRRDAWFRPLDFDEDHPALTFFSDPRWKPYLTEAPIYAFVASTPFDGARVLIGLDDPDNSALLVERAYDRGKVLLWTSSLDRDWTLVPESPSTFVPLVHELLRYAARRDADPRNVPVGAPLVAEVANFPRGATLVRPDASRRALEGDVAEVEGGGWRLPTVPSADAVGLWRIELDDAVTVSFAVQLDASEGDLARLGPGELESLHPALSLVAAGAESGGGDSDDPPARGELWRWMAGLALATLVLETLWAAFLGHRRRFA